MKELGADYLLKEKQKDQQREFIIAIDKRLPFFTISS